MSIRSSLTILFDFFFQAEDGIRDYKVTGVQTCALPICAAKPSSSHLDQFRARRQLVSLVQDRAVAAAAVADLVSVLRQPDLPVDRVDLVLQILLEGDTGGCADASIGTQLIEALRSG